MHAVFRALLLTLPLLLAACGGGEASTTPSGPTLTALTLSPSTTTVALGATQQYTVSGTYSDGSSAAVSTGISWSGGSGASVSAAGLATATALGSTTITATIGKVSASATLVVQGPWSALAAGGAHTLAVKSDGTLWAWGSNRFGQIGDGTATDRLTPVQIGSDKTWSAVAAGQFHSLGLKTDGTLWAWGFNQNGQLGDGGLVDRRAPVQVGSDKTWSQISAGDAHSVGVKKDGTAWAWGRNFSGQLGDGTSIDRASPVAVAEPLPVVVAWTHLAAGSGYTLGRRADGTLWAWGDNARGQLGVFPTTQTNGTVTTQPKPPLTANSTTSMAGSVKTIVSRYVTSSTYVDVTFAIDLGQAAPARVALPTKVASDPDWTSGADATWVAVAAGAGHSLALRADGALFAWGANDAGQLGLDSTSDTATQARVGSATTWARIAAGGSHSLAVRADGSLWSWGLNDKGQLGLGGTTTGTPPTQNNAPVQVGTATNWTTPVAGAIHSFALRGDNTVWGWGGNADGQLGNGQTANVSTPTQAP